MQTFLKSTYILALTLSLAFALRFYNLGSNPPSLNWDEVSNGYNAYSILKTARDEYGNFLPLSSRSFDDYKPPAYMYLTVPTIALFGLSETAVRLPSAILGTISVLLIFFLTKTYIGNIKISHLSAFFFAINPWTLHFSRVGFEANIALFFTIGTFLFLHNGLKEYSRNRFIYLVLSAVFIVAAIYSYHSTRLFLPLALLAYALIFRKNLLAFKKLHIVIFVGLITVILLPLILISRDSLTKRFQTTSQKATVEDLDKSVKLITEDQKFNQKFANIIHNRRLQIATSTANRYLSHFDINYLFLKGDNNMRHHIKNHGLLFLYQLPLVVFGLYFAIQKKSKEFLFVIFWLVLAPVPASFGDAFPHAIRSLNLAVPLTILCAYGAYSSYLISKFKKQYLLSGFVIFLFTLNFLHNYMVHYPIDEGSWWQFGYKQAVIETMKVEKSHRVLVDSSIEQSYAFWLFYTQEDPSTYQKSGNKDHFSNFYFSGEPTADDYYVKAGELPQGYEPVSQIKGPDDTTVISVGKKE